MPDPKSQPPMAAQRPPMTMQSRRRPAFAGQIPNPKLLLVFALLAAACDTDIGISDFKYACESDNDCGPGNKCEPGVGCMKFPETRDAGTADAGGSRDAGRDSGPGDAGPDAGDGGATDAGQRDGGFIVQFSSTSDSAGGAGSSEKYILKSVTGWSAGPKWNVGNYQLKSGNPFVGGSDHE